MVLTPRLHVLWMKDTTSLLAKLGTDVDSRLVSRKIMHCKKRSAPSSQAHGYHRQTTGSCPIMALQTVTVDRGTFPEHATDRPVMFCLP